MNLRERGGARGKGGNDEKYNTCILKCLIKIIYNLKCDGFLIRMCSTEMP